MMTREEIIDKIADLYIDNSDSDGSWESIEIAAAVMNLLVMEGDRLACCEHCGTNFPMSMYDDCPYYDGHPCSGGCGETNECCTCDCCNYCGYYDCECKRCTKCGEVQADCPCPEEEAVFA